MPEVHEPDAEAVNRSLAKPLPKSKLIGNNSSGIAKVEAEAEHLRKLEGNDYHMMENIIRRRLSRNSEDLDTSLEVDVL